MEKDFYKFTAETIDGKEISMEDFKGKVVVVVNTASKCGFTPQYEGLQKLYDDYKDRGLVILGFPCDQFAHQEPGTADEIKQFCSLNYGVNFPLFAKVDVNGPEAHPIFEYLRTTLPGKLGNKIKWNFTKFLIDSEGKPVKRFASAAEPAKMIKDIKRLI
jgi:glutathione peroxidase